MQKPEKKFNCGQISASIWARTKTVEGDTRKFYSVTIDKAYKEDEIGSIRTALISKTFPKSHWW